MKKLIRVIPSEVLRGDGAIETKNINMLGEVREKIKIIWEGGRCNYPFSPLRISNGIAHKGTEYMTVIMWGILVSVSAFCPAKHFIRRNPKRLETSNVFLTSTKFFLGEKLIFGHEPDRNLYEIRFRKWQILEVAHVILISAVLASLRMVEHHLWHLLMQGNNQYSILHKYGPKYMPQITLKLHGIRHY